MEYQFKISNELADYSGERVDIFLSSILKISRTKLQNNIKSGCLTINGLNVNKPNRILCDGDIINYNHIVLSPKPVLSEKIDLDVIYEDEYLIIINKDIGMITHPAGNVKSGSVVNALMHRGSINPEIYDFDEEDYEYRPGVVHRLDKDTSGLIVFAKSPEIQSKLSDLFKNRMIEKKYIALVYGNINEVKGIITYPIGRNKNNRKLMQIRDDGKPAITEFKTIERGNNYTLIEVNLKTGRTHQIRTHFKSINHPVVGDRLYSTSHKNESRLMLHSYSIKFIHPGTGIELYKIAPVKKDFADFLEQNGMYLKNYDFEQ
ncbi:RluA family pseudouridine synthase [Candidatus Dependentiae bacterium]|nr:RluA family pseudouridine synthase [Candidatus Dependentiae bacterium]